MTEIEDRWRELGEFIREQRRVGQLSLRKLSEMAGISNPYLSQIERGLRKPSAEILRNIAGALSISAETLYVRAGILDERDGDHDLVADIRRDPFIDEEQKKTLVHIYLSFRTAHLAAVGARVVPTATDEAELTSLPALLQRADSGADPDLDPGSGPDPDGDGARPPGAAPEAAGHAVERSGDHRAPASTDPAPGPGPAGDEPEPAP